MHFVKQIRHRLIYKKFWPQQPATWPKLNQTYWESTRIWFAIDTKKQLKPFNKLTKQWCKKLSRSKNTGYSIKNIIKLQEREKSIKIKEKVKSQSIKKEAIYIDSSLLECDLTSTEVATQSFAQPSFSKTSRNHRFEKP